MWRWWPQAVAALPSHVWKESNPRSLLQKSLKASSLDAGLWQRWPSSTSRRIRRMPKLEVAEEAPAAWDAGAKSHRHHAIAKTCGHIFSESVHYMILNIYKIMPIRMNSMANKKHRVHGFTLSRVHAFTACRTLDGPKWQVFARWSTRCTLRL